MSHSVNDGSLTRKTDRGVAELPHEDYGATLAQPTAGRSPVKASQIWIGIVLVHELRAQVAVTQRAKAGGEEEWQARWEAFPPQLLQLFFLSAPRAI